MTVGQSEPGGTGSQGTKFRDELTMISHVLDFSRAARPNSTVFRMQIMVLALTSTGCLAAFTTPIVAEGSSAAKFLNAIGWTCFGMGIALRFWSICHIAGRKSKIIVDTGPYALTRNPLYVGTFLIAFSEAAFLKSVWWLLGLAVVVVYYNRVVVPFEEQKLAAKLGAHFDEYAARVPRWLPRFDRHCLQSVEVSDYSAIRREFQCLLCWVIVPLVGLGMCWLRAQPWWPHFVPGF